MGSVTISVVISNYNHARYLPEAIDSVLSQSLPPKEFYIIDDGSTDDSVAVAERYASNHAVIKFTARERNVGGVRNVNDALATMQATHCISLSADDKLLPGYFETASALLERYPDAGLFLADFETFADDGRRSIRRLRLSGGARYFAPREVPAALYNRWPHGQAIVRLDALRAIGGYREELRWHCDWFALWSVCGRHGFCYAPVVGSAIRVAAATYSAAGRRSDAQRVVLSEILSLLERSEHKTLAAQMLEANALSHFGGTVVRLLLRRPTLRGLVSARLLTTVIARGCYNSAARVTPRAVKRWLKQRLAVVNG